MAERLTINPDYQHLSTTGALLFIAFGRWTKRTFAIYAAAVLPYFWFNYYFLFEVPVLNRWMELGFASNLAMFGLRVWGWRTAPAAFVPAAGQAPASAGADECDGISASA